MNIIFDIKYALRLLLKSPAFSVLTIAVMAVGLGVSIFIMSVVNTFVFEPINYADGERIVSIRRKIDNDFRSTLLHDFQKVKDESASFSSVSAFQTDTSVLNDGTHSVRFQGTNVTPDFFPLTGITPFLGRPLNDADHAEGTLPVAVLGYDIWLNFFGGDNEIVGKKVIINRKQVEIVGVAPKHSVHYHDNTLWMPLQYTAHQLPLNKSFSVNIFGKLKEGVSLEQAQLELNGIYSNSPELRATTDQNVSVDIDLLKHSFVRNIIPIFYLMLVASFFVLALCCINVGNLLLARANGKMKEIAIRVALGAPRSRLISQTMWEAFFICLLGGVFGILIAGWGLDAATNYFVDRSNTYTFPTWAHMSLSARDVGTGLIVTLITVFLTGFIPAWRSTGTNFNAVLKDASKTSLGKKAGVISKILVGIEIAVSCALMIVAGIFFVLVQQAVSEGYGISLDNYLVARVNPLEEFYESDAQKIAYFDRVISAAAAIRGVEKATLVSRTPTQQGASSYNFQPEGIDIAESDYPRAYYLRVYPNAFDTLNIPLLQGRLFDSRDHENAPKVAIISENFAELLWPDENPIGKRIRRFSDKKEKPGKWITIVGTVPLIVQSNLLSDEHAPNIYVPFAQHPRDAMAIVLKTESNPWQFQEPLARAMHSVDPNTPIYRTVPMAVQAEDNRAFAGFIERIFFLFALCALLMAATGIYGIMSNHVKQRTQEIGIRRALGIPDSSISLLMMKQSSIQLLAGFAVGLPVAYLIAMEYVSSIGARNLLYLANFFVVPLIIAGVVWAATMIPLSRVLAREPSEALRYE